MAYLCAVITILVTPSLYVPTSTDCLLPPDLPGCVPVDLKLPLRGAAVFAAGSDQHVGGLH